MTVLEEQQKKPKELSKLEILQMALESEQKVLALETKVSELAPKAAALDTIANATGQKTVTNVAKVLGVQPEKFLRPWMIKHHWIYLGRDGQYHAHAARIKDGHLVEKSRAIPRTNGIADIKVTVYVTALGETLLARRFAGEAA
jgi:phage antirepressor YoqD-like protein